MMTRATDVVAPSSDQSILADVEQYLAAHFPTGTLMFEHYDDALRAVWPGLYKDNPEAAIFMAINVYIESAEIKGFVVKPDYLRRAKKEGLI